MVVNCCVLGCKNYNDAKSKKNNISFHKVPKIEPERSKWLKVIPRRNGRIQDSIPQSQTLCVCSEHFKPTDYDPDTRLIRKRLNYGVIPSIFSQNTISKSIDGVKHKNEKLSDNRPFETEKDPIDFIKVDNIKTEPVKKKHTCLSANKIQMFDCYICQKITDHQTSNCPKLKCKYCTKKGHSKHKCPIIKRHFTYLCHKFLNKKRNEQIKKNIGPFETDEDPINLIKVDNIKTEPVTTDYFDKTENIKNAETFVDENLKQEIINFEEVNIKEEPKIDVESEEIQIEPDKLSIKSENFIENYSTNDPWKCNVCGKTYSSTYYLEKHKCAKVAKEFKCVKEFKCDLCYAIFKKKSDLRVHMICFHEEIKKNHKCNICNETFITLNNLKRHTYSVHDVRTLNNVIKHM